MRLNRFIQGDCLTVMRGMSAESFDVVVTSPPRNILNRRAGGPGVTEPPNPRRANPRRANPWRDRRKAPGGGRRSRSGCDGCADETPRADCIAWQRACPGETPRPLRPDGAICHNHKWRVRNGLPEDRREITDGLPVRRIIIRDRLGGINFGDGLFPPACEVIHLIAKPAFRLAEGANVASNIRRIPPERKNPHPAPFPLGPPLRRRRACAPTGGRAVPDPFTGSGATALAARELGRRWLGIKQSAEYIRMARMRPDAAGDAPPSGARHPADRPVPQTPPFGMPDDRIPGDHTGDGA